jgi:hypothetical protein
MMGLFRQLQERRAAKELLANPIVAAAVDQMRRSLDDPGTAVLHKASDKTKAAHVQAIVKIAMDIIAAENVVMKMREKLCDYVLLTTKYEVLINLRQNVRSWINHPAISRELFQHIGTIARKDKHIRELAFSADAETDGDILDLILVNYEICHAYMAALNSVRVALNERLPPRSRKGLDTRVLFGYVRVGGGQFPQGNRIAQPSRTGR